MTKLPGPAVFFALVILGTACTASPGGTVGTASTDVASPTTPTAGPAVTESFDEFVENSVEELTKRQPQLVTALGLDAVYGTRPDQLDDLSPEYALATAEVAESAVEVMTEIMEGPHFNHEIERYALYPGQATAYMVGMLAILDLRNSIGISTDDPEGMASFLVTFLGQGNVPLTVLPDVFGR